MNNLKYSILLLIIIMTSGAYAQKGKEYILKIDNKPVSVVDFENAYLKDIKSNTIGKPASVEDFLKSFSLLKTKVAEAETLGLNNETGFLAEYKKYAESAKSKYTNDTISPEKAAKLIYDRLNENIEVCSIFVPFSSNTVLPKDTLEAYNKITNIYQSVVNTPDSEFKKLALQHSEPSHPRGVETLWKTALMEEKPYEDAIYTTPIGNISQPIRTNKGYYLIKVYAKRPDRGEVRISHILLAYPLNATQAERDSVRSLSQKVITDLDKGLSFEAICNIVSADRETAERGGDLGWFSTRSNLIPTFDSIFYSLQKREDYTRPIESNQGFQIFKLTGKISLDSWPAIKPDLIKEIKDRDRNRDIETLKLKKLEDKYPYTINKTNYRKILDITNVYHASDSVFFKELTPHLQAHLVTIDKNKYTVSEFVNFIYSHPAIESTLSTDIIDDKLHEFILDRASDLNTDHIVETTPELKLLLQEYYDGLLLFSVMDKEVWSKSQTNIEGLTATFEQNRNKYLWKAPKYKGYVIYLKDQQALNTAMALQKEHGEDSDFITLLSKALNNDTTKSIYIEKGLWAKGENEFVDNVLYKTEVKKEVVGYPFFIIQGKLMDQPESYEDAKGAVVEDYQEVLEQEWVNNITKKHKVIINNKALKNLTKKYK